ncbi:MAG: DUF4900 domain-containing protein [Trueperaceae bacterium]|nr:DUF4900 domain-containing protein [Trueperaceae bacterium]
MQLRNRTKGVAMIAALSLMVVAAGVIAYLFANTINEMRHSGDSVASVQALALARGGAAMGNVLLNKQVKESVKILVQDNPNNGRFYLFGDGTGGQTSTPQSVIQDFKTLLTIPLQNLVDQALCNETVPFTGVGGEVKIRIYFTDSACGDALPPKTKLAVGRFVEGQIYAIPFILVSEATLGKYRRNIVIQGEFQFDIMGGKFSKYALFTNKHNAPDGTDIWFTDNTLFDGPVHTNSSFRFYRKPWFGGTVSSAGCADPDNAIATAADPNYITCTDFTGASFFHGSPQFIGADALALGANTDPDEPEFQSGVEYRATVVPFPENAFEQRDAAQNSGLYFPSDLYSLEFYAANAAGALPTKTGTSWTPKAQFQYIKSCTDASTCAVYRYGDDGKLFQQNSDGTWPTSPIVARFNGVVYTEGKVDRFGGPKRSPATSTNPDDAPPALASFGQITMVSTGKTRIVSDLTYEQPPCSGSPKREADGSVTRATCNNTDAQNVLGIFSPGSDILIGNANGDASLNAPNNIAIHASIMSSSGQVAVENHTSGVPRGEVNLLGGIIENFYGAFGTFNNVTGNFTTGYGRRFTYDTRLAKDLAPPYFPTTKKNDVPNVFVIGFSQREQVY